jgi:hypothetical protein
MSHFGGRTSFTVTIPGEYWELMELAGLTLVSRDWKLQIRNANVVIRRALLLYAESVLGEAEVARVLGQSVDE